MPPQGSTAPTVQEESSAAPIGGEPTNTAEQPKFAEAPKAEVSLKFTRIELRCYWCLVSVSTHMLLADVLQSDV